MQKKQMKKKKWENEEIADDGGNEKNKMIKK